MRREETRQRTKLYTLWHDQAQEHDIYRLSLDFVRLRTAKAGEHIGDCACNFSHTTISLTFR